jgi:hypothetical protein
VLKNGNLRRLSHVVIALFVHITLHSPHQFNDVNFLIQSAQLFDQSQHYYRAFASQRTGHCCCKNMISSAGLINYTDIYSLTFYSGKQVDKIVFIWLPEDAR